MKAKINIEIWDSTTCEVLNKAGWSNDALKKSYEFAFKSILDETTTTNGSNYSLDVEITDEVN